MITNDNLYKTLKAAYDPDACAEAMKEWLEDQAAANEKLLADIADISTDESLEVDDSISWWTSLLESRGYNVNIPVQIVDEYYSLGSLVRSAYYSGAGALVDDNGELIIPNIRPLFPEDDPVTGLARLKDVGSDMLETASRFTMDTMDEVYTNIKSNLHSVVAMAGAVAASKFESVPERLTYFRDYITRKFSNAYSDISNMASSMTDMLENVKGPSDVLQSLNEYIGLEGITSEEAYTPISNSDVYRFTGANPAGALDFSTAKSALSSTVKVAANVVKGIFKSAISGIKRLFRKIKSKFTAVTTNPVDIAIRDNDAEFYCVDGLHCPSTTTGDNVSLGAIPQDLRGVDLSDVVFPETFVIESWFGHLLVSDFHFNRATFELNRPGARGRASAAWTPYFINLQNFIDEVINPVFNRGETEWNEGTYFLTLLEQFAMNGELYLTPSSDTAVNNERLMLGGLLASSVLGKAILRFDESATGSSLVWSTFNELRDKLLKCDIRSATCDLPDTVTNADFFAAATGINKVAGTVGVDEFKPMSGQVFYRSKSNGLAWTALGYYPDFQSGTAFIIYNRTQKKFYPTTYPFCPYNTKRTNSPEGKFYIKTDAQNRDTFNNFGTAAVIAAVVAVVAVVAGVTLKAKANKAKLRFAGAQRNYENVLGNPNSTTAQIKEAKRAYKKAKLTNKILNGASSGLQTTVSQASNAAVSESNDVNSYFTQIKSLIKGSID